MSSPLDFLKSQAEDLEGKRASIESDLGDLYAAINAIEARHNGKPTGQAHKAPTKTGTKINDAIVEAVRNDAALPLAIVAFMDRHLGVKTTRNSVSTRLGKLRDEGLLAHNGTKWIIPKDKAPPDDSESASRNTGESGSSTAIVSEGVAPQ